MDTIYNAFGLGLLLLAVNHIISSSSQCLTGCTCATARHGRSLLCMETALFKIPEDIPGDFTKIRIEKSHLTEIPKSAFCQHKSLQHLWLNFNNITIINIQSLEGLANLTELRLEGNKLRSIPWTAFEDTPSLRILDLKHNWLDVLPEHALKYLPYLTYLDLSFNQLTVASRDVFLKWPLYDTVFRARARETVHTNVVLALHENPWLCDCRLRGFVEFVRNLSPPFILMNSYLSCSGPENMAGKFFHEIELKTCTKPVATSPSTNISSALRANVTLPCFAMGRPPPAVWWTYGLKILRGFQEFQTHVNEDTIKSELVIPSLQLSDQGVYTCTANNFIGNASVSILVDIKSTDGSKSPAFSPAPEENVYIDIHIAKQTVYGISIEWYAVTEKPSETWFTIHFGHYDSPTKELIHVGPGINTYSVTDLLPTTKYDICVTLKNQAPRSGQCIVFVTGSDMSEMEQREQLIHIVVIVFAMVLAVPAGMYACTTDAKFHCFKRGLEMCRNCRRSEQTYITNEGQVTFDSFQVASDEVLCKDSSEGHKTHRRSDDRVQKNKLEQKPTTQLY